MKLRCLELAESGNYAGKCAVKTPFQITFPNGDDLPFGLAEVASLFAVACNVTVKFFLPKRGVVLWERIFAFRAAVPKTAVDKDRQPA